MHAVFLLMLKYGLGLIFAVDSDGAFVSHEASSNDYSNFCCTEIINLLYTYDVGYLTRNLVL